tara:strand:+ start:832 stop:1560 length:729 start_codon:yes stop_codon:yes gene_type:complete
MILYPAIDLKEGRCVRLFQGDMERATVFNDNPAEQARAFEAIGFEWLHMVDLDGAFAGRSVNTEAIEAVLAETGLSVQLGGGIRSLDHIAHWLDRRVARVVLGTVALRDPDLVREACRNYPGRIAVGIDARHGQVAVSGWAEQSTVAALDLALRFEDAGVAAIIYTDISRDGTMEGPNVEATATLAEALTTPVIASGGVSRIEDLAALKAVEGSGIAGVISGRALYDGSLDPAEARALLAAA